MTTIYQVGDPVNNKTYYFVPDSATQTQGEALNMPNSIWQVGDITLANQQLATSQQSVINNEILLQHLSQTVSVGQDEDGNNIWQVCDVTTETDNLDKIYELHNGVNPGFQRATGLSQAMTIYQTQQQEILTWLSLTQVITLTALPTVRKIPSTLRKAVPNS
jgi:hypothetical protein